MTREETKKILMIMETTWSNYKPDRTREFVDIWTELLGDLPYPVVAAALKAYAQTDRSGFAPSVGQLRGKADELIHADELTDSEAWNLTYRAICRSAYYAEQEFEKLPAIVQKAVGGPETLRGWALAETDPNFIQASFKRTFNAVKEKEKTRRQMSPDLLAIIDNRIFLSREASREQIPQQED